MMYERTLIRRLVATRLAIVAPLLRSDGLYSNFWSAMTEEYYYKRTDDYRPIAERERIGCFRVPMVHSCVLSDLTRTSSEHLSYVPPSDTPHDDIIAFAISSNLSTHVCNDVPYGYVPVPLDESTASMFEEERVRLLNVRLDALADGFSYLKPTQSLARFVSLPSKDTLRFDAIYMINLLRRPERRVRMQASFDELGLLVQTIDAVDGR